MVKIVIADKMEDEAVAKIKTCGDVFIADANSLNSLLENADVLIVRSATKVDSTLISNAKNLKLVIRAGVGLDNVDAQSCAQKGIAVKNTPGASTNAVAELAIAMILSVSRKIGFLHSKMLNKNWAKKLGTGVEIQSKTLAIIGMGRIGQSTAQKASALGMNVIYTDREKKEGLNYKYYSSVNELLGHADYISLHASAKKGDPAIIGATQFSKCKKGAFLINLARGSLVDEPALINALKSSQIAGAAIDVYASEPYTGELCSLDNVLLTPHIGASTIQAQSKIADEIVEHIKNL